jgi:hypothetical protein
VKTRVGPEKKIKRWSTHTDKKLVILIRSHMQLKPKSESSAVAMTLKGTGTGSYIAAIRTSRVMEPTTGHVIGRQLRPTDDLWES